MTKQTLAARDGRAIQALLDYADAAADWLLGYGEARLRDGSPEDASRCVEVAASILCRQNRTLTCPRLERLLIAIAAAVQDDSVEDGAAEKPIQRGRLHVLTDALPAGGLTAMAWRWVLNDPDGTPHHVALLAQAGPVPPSLRQAVELSGGAIHLAPALATTVEKALWLRRLAGRVADPVVLHVDVCDAVSPIAFGVAGGPRVMTVNHTAHLYWAGVASTDLVLNCRGSELEAQWASVYRGASLAAPLPIPLDEARVQAPDSAERRRRVREAAGIHSQAVVLLTVGSAFKYLATSDVDFVSSVERVLSEVAHGVLLVAGFDGDHRWREASDRVGGRIRTLGRLSQEALADLHDACDIYVEGFPFGTTTSLLEAASRGMAVVLAPAVCPPPYGTDGIAVDGIVQRPASIGAFEREIVRLAGDARARAERGTSLRRAVADHHAGSGWRRHVTQALAALPERHNPRVPPEVCRTPEGIHEYWFRFHELWSVYYEEVLESSLLTAYVAGLRPPLTATMLTARRRSATVLSGRRVPTSVLRIIANVLAPRTSPGTALMALRAVRLLWRRGPAQMGREVVSRLLGRRAPDRAISPYAEYRAPSP